MYIQAIPKRVLINFCEILDGRIEAGGILQGEGPAVFGVRGVRGGGSWEVGGERRFGYQLSIPEIVAEVVSGLGISKESIYRENRNPEGSFRRWIVGYLARHLTGYPLKSVAEHFGRDPVAISQGVGKLELGLRKDENLERRITELAENLAQRRKEYLFNYA